MRTTIQMAMALAALRGHRRAGAARVASSEEFAACSDEDYDSAIPVLNKFVALFYCFLLAA